MKTEAEFVEQLKQIWADYGSDPEIVHSKADDLLCEALRQFMPEVVKEYENTPCTFWYA